ncbi:mRNA interferase MazF [Kitasatospora sp. SolWspMP-SS2h]|uniref:type II toxin-antitoxin system PemK/MazF family toxin n=1 Tax=Kitasatospora sp. SolWspMP-SS2h TaxID=1305729 RepID=UPI000DBF84B9|nr:type II toxin-antitoxin system PemK/MazF family toxin [Kitasatospora sp. SolWspMP-SS2h]RAJ44147.1 mRNA interferase MazF [Kitasatospora sp. SolWspMP-SS2h]
MTARLEALRGEVWICAKLPGRIGIHPVVVLTANRIAQPLSAVTVALITGTSGPPETRVALGADSGLMKYAESHVDCTSLHTVAKSSLRSRRGRLDIGELAAVERAVRRVIGLGS